MPDDNGGGAHSQNTYFVDNMWPWPNITYNVYIEWQINVTCNQNTGNISVSHTGPTGKTKHGDAYVFLKAETEIDTIESPRTVSISVEIVTGAAAQVQYTASAGVSASYKANKQLSVAANFTGTYSVSGDYGGAYIGTMRWGVTCYCKKEDALSA